MRRTTLGVLVVFSILAAACTTFTLVKPEKVTIGDYYTIDSPISWSRLTEGKTQIWTVDGPLLQELRFVVGLEDGEGLIKSDDPKKKIPPFRSRMTPVEIMEMVEGVFAASEIRNITTRNLRPEKFGGIPGFRFELSYATKDGLEKEGFAVGAIKDKRLHLIIYRGAKLYYFPKHKGHAEKIVRSITML